MQSVTGGEMEEYPLDNATFTLLVCGMVGIPALCVLVSGLVDTARDIRIWYRHRKRRRDKWRKNR